MRWASALSVLGLAGVRAQAAPPPRKLLVVLCWGGWDVTLAFDPKVGEPEIDDATRHEDPTNPDDREVLRTFGGIPLMTNAAKRPAVTTFFERWHPQTTVVNGLWTGSIAHEPAQYRMLTGTRSGRNPDLAVIAGHVHGTEHPLGCIDLSSRSYPGRLAPSTGRIGSRGQLKALLEPSTSFRAPEHLGISYPQYLPTQDDEAAAQAYLQGRADRFRQQRADPHNESLFDDLEESRLRAQIFTRESEIIRGALTLGTTLGYPRSLALGVDLLDAGICHTSIVDTGMLWDTHTENGTQYGNFERTFHELDATMSLLEDRQMLDSTLVLVLSEMGRTPKFNNKDGRDHWPHTSALVLGGGLTGSRVFGATDGLLESKRVDLASGAVTDAGEYNRYSNFHAGLLELLDVDPEAFLPGITPFRALST
jgi:hypothetical protein